MTRVLQFCFLGVFFVLASLPVVEMLYPFAPRARLFGSTPKPPEVSLSWASYLSGEFQQAYEQWFATKLGLRAHLVRTDNEINLRAFRQFNQNSNAALILGKNGFLYERAYIDALNRRDIVPASFLEEKVLRIKVLQDYLRARGSTLLLVISPSKPMLYPEYLPERYLDPHRQHLPTNYDQFVPLLAKHGINVLDTQAYFAANKGQSEFPFFANTGAHWNDPAACDIAAQIVRFVGTQVGESTAQIKCDPVVLKPTPNEADRDLLRLGNVWVESALYQQTPYPKSTAIREGEVTRPNVLFVGSSFVWTLLRFLNKHSVFHRNVFYYYYSSRYVFPGKQGGPISAETIDWEKEVFGRKAVIIEVNAAVVQNVGFGFLEDAEKKIRGAL